MSSNPQSNSHSLSHQIIEDLRTEFLSPLKLISYPFLVSFLFPYLTMDWSVTSTIFSSLWIPAIATLGIVAFNEIDIRHEMRLWEWIFLVFVLFINAFTVEFTGIAIHTLTSFFQGQHNSNVNFWDGFAIVYTIIGGVGISVSHSVGRHYRHVHVNANVSDKHRVLLGILFTVLLVLSWIFEYQLNPHDPLRILITYLLTSHPI